MDPSDLKQLVRQEAARLGFHRVGFSGAGPCADAGRLDDWLEEGRHGEMRWMARETERRTDPRRILPGARTVISLATFHDAPPEADATRTPVGRVSRYAGGRDYHRVIGRRLRKLIRSMARAAPGPKTLAAVDHRPVLEKEWAVRAGLGWIGKHTNLITEDRGSWLFLAELITEHELPPDAEPRPNRCGKCTDCIAACPTGAIVGPYQVDARRCISYLTIALRGAIPVELRPLVGEWIFGCDVCQEVCPVNADADDAGPLAVPLLPLIEWLLPMGSRAFGRVVGATALTRAGRHRLLRNAIAALGNVVELPAGGVELLERAARDRRAEVRLQAMRVLGRV
jgi:epoxyqueuosine reductase